MAKWVFLILQNFKTLTIVLVALALISVPIAVVVLFLKPDLRKKAKQATSGFLKYNFILRMLIETYFIR